MYTSVEFGLVTVVVKYSVLVPFTNSVVLVSKTVVVIISVVVALGWITVVRADLYNAHDLIYFVFVQVT